MCITVKTNEIVNTVKPCYNEIEGDHELFRGIANFDVAKCDALHMFRPASLWMLIKRNTSALGCYHVRSHVKSTARRDYINI